MAGAANRIKEKFVGIAGSVSGITSVLGSWQLCHSLCLGLIAFLGILGITVVGMPLLFLQEIALPFWAAAVIFLAIAVFIYFRKRCLSYKLILLNSGLVIAGTPFQSLQPLSPLFWLAGGALVALSIALFVKDRLRGRQHHAKDR